jgi:lipoprotein-anchoring transpeptidase ErfK/SrfK
MRTLRGVTRRTLLGMTGIGVAALGLRPALVGAAPAPARVLPLALHAFPEDVSDPNPWPVPAWDMAPPAPTDGRAVVVSLSMQALWAYENGEVVRSTYVSTGMEGTPTPVGLFWVNNKFPIETMEGTIAGEDYLVKDVPDVMYFNDQGDALHGAYWHSNFGVPMSHGCVNLPLDVAAWMYEWAPMGMAVQILA